MLIFLNFLQVFINGGGTMDGIKYLEQTANPFEDAVITLILSTDWFVGTFVTKINFLITRCNRRVLPFFFVYFSTSLKFCVCFIRCTKSK